jgi:hypothetical protein
VNIPHTSLRDCLIEPSDHIGREFVKGTWAVAAPEPAGSANPWLSLLFLIVSLGDLAQPDILIILGVSLYINTCRRMSASGHKRPVGPLIAGSGRAPRADVPGASQEVRDGPLAHSCTAAIRLASQSPTDGVLASWLFSG